MHSPTSYYTINILHLLVTFALISICSGTVRIVEDDWTGSRLTVDDSSFSLTCEYTHNSSITPQFTFMRNERIITGFASDTSSQAVDNGRNVTMYRIMKTDFTINDGGLFSCFVDGKSANITIRVIKQDQKFEQSYRHYEDERVVLPCPVPTALHANVTWYKDGILLDNDRVAFEDFETKRNSRLVFSQVKKEDHGVYVCVATMTVATKSYTTRLRVIDKLAPLWPFLGIVIEISILAGIIYVCGRAKKKTNPQTKAS